MREKKKENKGITLIALIITIIVMLILVGVSIKLVINSGLFENAHKATILTVVSMVKEEIGIDKMTEMIDGNPITVEQLLAEGKIKRTIEEEGTDTYYLYYALKEGAYSSMKGYGKGTTKDVFLIDKDFNIKYMYMIN